MSKIAGIVTGLRTFTARLLHFFFPEVLFAVFGIMILPPPKREDVAITAADFLRLLVLSKLAYFSGFFHPR